MEIQAFALLCALACICFTASVHSARAAGPWLAGFAAGLLLINPGGLNLPLTPLVAIDPAQMALLIFLLAFARVRNAGLAWPVHAGAGVLAAVWLLALRAQGYPLPLAWLQVSLLAATAFVARLRRPEFCTPAHLEEALLIVMAAALAVVVVPEMLAGWNAAASLQAVGTGAETDTGNEKVVLVAVGFVLLGAAYATWKNRMKARWTER